MWYGLPALGVDISRYKPQAVQIRIIDLFGSVLFAPIVETMLLAFGLRILSRIAKRTVPLAVLSALIWGAIHGLLAATRFAGTAWSFFIFSIAYLTWRDLGRTRAFAACAIPHALLNLFALVLLPFGVQSA
jgi:hypothetical protein